MRPAALWAERRKAQGAERINRNKRFERQRKAAPIEVAEGNFRSRKFLPLALLSKNFSFY